MRRLYFSLILTLILAISTIGWLFDAYLSFQSEKNNIIERAEYASYVAMAQKAAVMLSELSTEEQPQYLNELNALAITSFGLLSTDDISLPMSEGNVPQQREWFIESTNERFLLTKVNEKTLLKTPLPILPELQQSNALMSIVLYSALCMYALVWLMPLLRNITRLEKAFARFGGGDLSVQIPLRQSSYLKPLETGFNRMAGRINELVENNKLMASTFSHDIKHPLSCMEFTLESMKNEMTHSKHIERLENDISHLNELVNNFSDYNRITRQDIELSLQAVNYFEWVQQTAKSFADAAPSTIQVTGDPLLIVEIDTHWMTRVLKNIFQNAIEQSATQIDITLSRNEWLELRIEDNGSGIDQAYWQDAFQPYQSHSSSKGRSNHGLGLAIVQSVIAWHGGAVTFAEPQNLTGAALIISLPKIR